MDMKQIEDLMRLMQAQGFNECEWEKGDLKIKLVHKSPQPVSQGMPSYPFLSSSALAYQQLAPLSAPLAMDYAGSGQHEAGSLDGASQSHQAKTPRASKNRKEIRSPFVGTFYESAAPGQSAFVSKGSKVSKGETLCIVEAMKLMNELESDYDGVITEILVQNEEPVEFDQLLFVIEST